MGVASDLGSGSENGRDELRNETPACPAGRNDEPDDDGRGTAGGVEGVVAPSDAVGGDDVLTSTRFGVEPEWSREAVGFLAAIPASAEGSTPGPGSDGFAARGPETTEGADGAAFGRAIASARAASRPSDGTA